MINQKTIEDEPSNEIKINENEFESIDDNEYKKYFDGINQDSQVFISKN